MRTKTANLLLAALLAMGLFGACALGAEAPAAANEEGFVSIFNGKDLTGWDGDPNLWSVADGCIRGQTTAEKKAHGNTFCIWRAGKLKDFVLKIKFRIQNGNSGVQYRSQEKPGNATPGTRNRWGILGYQAEVEDAPGKVGFLYDEARRGWLVNVGDLMELNIVDGKLVKEVVGKINDKDALVKNGYYKKQDWNEYTITCRGNHVMQELNGHLTVEMIDNDAEKRSLEGLLALQIHAGPPMVVEFKDIRVKHLTEPYGEAIRLFNGKDMAGWTLSGDNQKNTWNVKDGALCTTGKPAGYIRTEKDYANFVLRVQLRHHARCNAGVLIRMTGQDKVWPKSIECQGQKDSMGDIWNIDKFPMKTAEDRTKGRHTVKMHPTNEKPLEEWNQYEIYMNKGDLRIYVNGLLQNSATDCQEVAGKICLQSEGNALDYRELVLIPIGSRSPKPAAPGGQSGK